MSKKTLFSLALRSTGKRATRQRQLILEALEVSQGHLDAEDIYARVREARVSLATVYRTLTLLKALGLVQEHALGENHGHFEIAPESPHYHFSCLRCHRVIEFESPQIGETIQALSENLGIEIEDAYLFLNGYCPECLARR